jgi:hypothetical protein
MHAFGSLEQVGRVLDALADREEPLVTALERQAGRKETRYTDLLVGSSGAPAPVPTAAPTYEPTSDPAPAPADERRPVVRRPRRGGGGPARGGGGAPPHGGGAPRLEQRAALRAEVGERLVEPRQGVAVEDDAGGLDVLDDVRGSAAAGDRDDGRVLREQPGEGQLAGARSSSCAIARTGA